MWAGRAKEAQRLESLDFELNNDVCLLGDGWQVVELVAISESLIFHDAKTFKKITVLYGVEGMLREKKSQRKNCNWEIGSV